MQKKMLISLGLIAISGLVMQAHANSTIYTDDLGRLHFLGKDPGAKTLQKIEDYNNPAQQDLTNVMFKDGQKSEPNASDAEYGNNISQPAEETLPAEGNEAPAVNTEPASGETPVADTKKGHTNKSKGSFTFNKGSMDASDPYTFGNTNLDYQKKDENQLEDLSKKRFWQIW